MAKTQKVRILIATLVGGAILLLVALKLLSAGAPSRFDYIHSQASSLGFEQERIISFVRDEIAYQKYDGVLRGAVGTLWGARGNSYDQAVLLHDLLRHAGVPVQYAGDANSAWVQVQDSGHWSDVYPAKELEGRSSTWSGLDIPADKFHRLEAVLVAKSKAGSEEKVLTLRTADLAGAPLILMFAGSEAKLALDGDETAMVAAPIPDESLAITFRHFRPGIAEPMVITREFYSKLYTEYRDESNSKNTHVIAALPCRFTERVWRQIPDFDPRKGDE